MSVASNFQPGDFGVLFRISKFMSLTTAHATPPGWTYIRHDMTQASSGIKISVFSRVLDSTTSYTLPALPSGDGNANNMMVIYRNVTGIHSTVGEVVTNTSTTNWNYPDLTDASRPVLSVAIGNTIALPTPGTLLTRTQRSAGYTTNPNYLPFQISDILTPTTTAVAQNVPIGASSAGQIIYNFAFAT